MGADLHMAQLMPLPLSVSCFSKIQIALPFWYRLTEVVPKKGPLNGCVCVRVLIDERCSEHVGKMFFVEIQTRKITTSLHLNISSTLRNDGSKLLKSDGIRLKNRRIQLLQQSNDLYKADWIDDRTQKRIPKLKLTQLL